jgi:hypothetical protein
MLVAVLELLERLDRVNLFEVLGTNDSKAVGQRRVDVDRLALKY